jgi:heat-inducible transcriptional repressor
MADLEEEGLLKSPHTSAGRIPSDAGYRLFVDGLMERRAPLPSEELSVLERFQVDARDMNDVLQHTAKITAVLAHCTAIVRAPRMHSARIHHLQLLPLADSAAMLVLITDAGSTISQMVHLPSPVSADEFQLLTNFLNAHLRHLALDQLTSRKLEQLTSEMAAYEQVIRTLWHRLHGAQQPAERIFVSNASFLAHQPEFDNATKLRGLLGLLEHEQAMASLLTALNGDGRELQISIGGENPLADLHECSVVSAQYQVGGQVIGEIGVLGPTRMEYARAVSAVETMARYLSATLTRLFGFRPT